MNHLIMQVVLLLSKMRSMNLVHLLEMEKMVCADMTHR